MAIMGPPKRRSPSGMLIDNSAWLSALVLLSLWEASGRAGLVSRIFFPIPSTILGALWSLLLSGDIAKDLAATLWRLLCSLGIGGAAGLLTGWLIGASESARSALEPYVSAFHPLPKLAIFPLFLVLLGIGEGSRIAVIATTAFFPVVINTQAGIRQIDRAHWEVARNYGANRRQLLTRVAFPGSLPMILAGFKIAANMALAITIAVEMLSAQRGLGALIWNAWNSLRTPKLYATLVLIVILGVAGNGLFSLASRFLVPWQHKAE